MQLRKDQIVKLLPGWVNAGTLSAPVWGGQQGYILGRVIKTLTGDHDKTKHVVVVEWGNNCTAAFPEDALREATNDEVGIARDATTEMGPLIQDVFVLIKTTLGNFALNAVECFPCGMREKSVRYAAITSRQTLPSVDNSDYNLMSTLLSLPDYTELRSPTIYSAVSHIFSMWNLPDIRSVSLPMPTFPTIREAASFSPPCPGVLLFHLPKNIIDYSDSPPPF